MVFEEIGVDYFHILVVSIISFVVGWLWHGPLFGKPWMKEMGFTKQSMEKAKKGMVKSMILNFIGLLVMMSILGQMVAYLGLSTFTEAASYAIFIWLAFFAAATLLNSVIWEGKSWKLYAISAGYWLVNLIIATIIFALWK